MNEHDIGSAIRQVQRIQHVINERGTFRGYSGTARLVGAAVALGGAAALSFASIPATPLAHLLGWGAVLAAALLANYGGLFAWFLFHPEADRNILKLTPAIDAVPPLAVGAALSAAAILHQVYDILPGIWMSCYGLVHIPYRKSLPIANYGVGIFYLVAGTLCLLFQPHSQTRGPWGWSSSPAKRPAESSCAMSTARRRPLPAPPTGKGIPDDRST